MTLIVSVLAVLALLVGTALGTFRHRQYGVWGFFGVLLAMVVADAVGPALGLYLAGVVAGNAETVVYLVRMLLLFVVAGFFSYYCDDLIPEAQDPKTRQDNIIAGLLGFVNTYLMVAYLIRALGGLGPNGNDMIMESWVNSSLVALLPWMMATIFVVVFGWSSVRKVTRAIAKLRGVPATTTPPRPTPVTPAPSYNSSPYNSAYSTPTTTTTSNAPVEAKPSAWSRLTGWMSRPKDESTGTPPANTLSNTGVTPPHGLSGLSGGSSYTSPTSGYSNTSTTSGFGNAYSSPSSSYGNTGTTSGYGSTGTTSGYGNTGTTSGYGSTGTTSGYGSTGTTSGYGSTGTTSGYGNTGTTSGYGNTGTTSGNTYNNPTTSYGNTGSFGVTPPSSSSGVYPVSPASSSSTGDSKLASSIFGPVTPVYSQSSFGSSTTSNSQQKDDDDDDDNDGYYYDDEDSNNNPPPYRG